MGFCCQTAFVAIAATNFTEVQDFYQRLLEQSPTEEIPNVYVEFQLPNLQLGIFRPKDAAEFDGSGTISLCLEMDDLDEAIAHLKAVDLPLPDAMMTASHGREAYIYDPAGSRIILHQARSSQN